MVSQSHAPPLPRQLQGDPPEHPVAIQIAAMVPRYKWTRTWFTRNLNKRVRSSAMRCNAKMDVRTWWQLTHSPCAAGQAEDIEGRPMPTLAALENFTEDTSSSLLYLTLESLRIRNMDADHAASHIGTVSRSLEWSDLCSTYFVGRLRLSRQGRRHLLLAARYAVPPTTATDLSANGPARQGTRQPAGDCELGSTLG